MTTQTSIHITLGSQKHGDRLSLLQKDPAFALNRGERENVINYDLRVFNMFSVSLYINRENRENSGY